MKISRGPAVFAAAFLLVGAIASAQTADQRADGRRAAAYDAKARAEGKAGKSFGSVAAARAAYRQKAESRASDSQARRNIGDPKQAADQRADFRRVTEYQAHERSNEKPGHISTAGAANRAASRASAERRADSHEAAADRAADKRPN